MSSISIDQLSEKIYHSSTKDYFGEVLQSYINGNYRSATVMLYSVVICDLVFKLKELVEKYEDEKATQILEEIRRLRERDERSPEWESKLVEYVYNRTNLLEVHEYSNILHLRDHRHLSAHPVLDNLDILFNPNKETVRAHMRNMLEGLLIKTPLLSNEIITSFVVDISSVKETLVQEGALERYLETKYFNHFSILLEKRIFKSVWRFVFKLQNQECNENREINFKVLQIMLRRRGQELIEYISEEKTHFSDMTESEETITYLIDLCSIYRPIYYNLEEHLQVVLQTWIGNHVKLFIKAIFLSESAEAHLKFVENRIINDDEVYTLDEVEIKFLFELAEEANCLTNFYDLMIKYFEDSSSFNSADVRFDFCILPYLEKFRHHEFTLLLNAINTNNQLSNRRKAEADNNIIKTYSDQIFGDQFDYSTNYPRFKF